MGEKDDTTPQSEVGQDASADTGEAEDDFVIEEEDEQPKDTIKRLREQLKECTAKKQEYLDGWQRAKADMVNTKKEFSKERQRLRSRITEEVIADVLPVLDSFEMAFADESAWNKVDKQWRSGVEQIYNQLKGVLKSHNVEEIRPAVGDEFDPQLHSSVATETTDKAGQEDTVAAVEKTGYRIDDRIIRSANVVVYKLEEEG